MKAAAGDPALEKGGDELHASTVRVGDGLKCGIGVHRDETLDANLQSRFLADLAVQCANKCFPGLHMTADGCPPSTHTTAM